MSEPVSKAEIEDVLSSIRRLVSENTGPIRRDGEVTAAAEKLVLTPAFRVHEAEPAAEAEAETASEVGAATEAVPAKEAEGGESPQAEAQDDGVEAESVTPEAAVAEVVEAQDNLEPETAEPEASEPEAAPVLDEGALAPEDEVMPSEASESAVADPMTLKPAEARPLSPLEQRIAELETVVAQSAAEFEPDGSEDDENPEGFVYPRQIRPEPDKVEPDPETGAQDAAETMRAASEPVEAEMPPREEPEQASEAEATLADDAGEPRHQPDAPEAAQDWEDVAASAQTAAAEDWEDVAPQTTDAGSADAPEESDEADAVIDEDALREMVARMVRDELQGRVGERITHNVRRMVRREIARALSLQEFE
jgi:hypothetical protein